MLTGDYLGMALARSIEVAPRYVDLLTGESLAQSSRGTLPDSANELLKVSPPSTERESNALCCEYGMEPPREVFTNEPPNLVDDRCGRPLAGALRCFLNPHAPLLLVNATGEFV